MNVIVIEIMPSLMTQKRPSTSNPNSNFHYYLSFLTSKWPLGTTYCL